ncbi:predicted protein, partial [Arabidopsis lyrata subsp. lyrata]
DLPLTTEVVLKIRPFCPVETGEIIYVQDSPVRNNDQAPPSDAAKQIINAEEYFEGQEWPLTEEEIRKIYSYQPETTQGISKVQDSQAIVRSDKNVSTSMKVESNNNNDQVQYPPSLLNIRFGNLRR